MALTYLFGAKTSKRKRGNHKSSEEETRRKKKAWFNSSVMGLGPKGGRETGVASEFLWRPYEWLVPPPKGA